MIDERGREGKAKEEEKVGHNVGSCLSVPSHENEASVGNVTAPLLYEWEKTSTKCSVACKEYAKGLKR